MKNTETTKIEAPQPISQVTIKVVVKAGHPNWELGQIGKTSRRLLFIEDEGGDVIYQSKTPFLFQDRQFSALSENERTENLLSLFCFPAR